MNRLKVRKREGEIVDFDSQKILNAIGKAYSENGIQFQGSASEQFFQDWIDQTFVSCDREEGDDIIDIEHIQDMVQRELILKDYNVGLSYILYREHQRQDRVLVEEQMQFVENYMKSSNTANATVDDNSNVGNKNVGVLNAEIHKGRNILSNRGWIKKKLKKSFPEENLHKQYIKDLKSRVFYKNDENSFPFPVPYTYSAKETVVVKLNGKKLCLALDNLYAIVDGEESILNVEDNAYAKYPKDLYVKDKDGWTQITRLVRKERRRDLVRVKTAFGEDVVVTDNHPMIVNENIDDNVQAIDSVGHKQLRVNQNIGFGEKKELDLSSVLDYVECYDNFLLFQDKERSQYNAINRHVKLDRDFGYVVGFFIGDGHYNNATGGMLSFTQKERSTLEALADKLWKSCGVVTTIYNKKDKSNCWNARVHSNALVSLFRNVFNIKDYAQNKNIPLDIFEYSREFALGVLEGIVDSDGTVESESQVSIRLSSRECICQLAVLLKELGFGASMFTQSTPFSNNGAVHQNYTIWGVRFSNTKNCEKLNGSYKWRNLVKKEVYGEPKYKNGWATITGVTKIENGSFLLQNKFIYDITTKTHSFVANNLFVHNCVSSTMYPFYLHGLFTLGGKSSRPKNLDSYCGMFCNLVFALSGMFAGAVALPEALVYFDFYARKEWGDDYYKRPNDLVTADWVLRQMTIEHQCRQYFEQMIHTINQPSGARGQQSAFVNFAIFDQPFFEGMFGNFYFDPETLEQPKWESVQWLQELFMEWLNAERLRTVLTFPVVSVTLLNKDGKWADERMVDFVCKEWSEGDSFFVYISDSIDSLSSCCRLKNKIQTKEFNFTNGNMGVETGSKSVISLNLSRIMQNFFREVIGDTDVVVKDRVSTLKAHWGQFQEYLNAILSRIYKYHIAYNEVLFDFFEAGLLPAYSAGFIDLNKQYLTVGINGLNQSAEFCGIQCNDNEDYQWYCEHLFSTIKDSNTAHNGLFNGHKLTFNTECVPAESLAVKNYNWDKEDGYWVPEDTNLYASYIFKPNDKEVDLFDKITLHGKRYIGDFLDGGSAAHLNLDAHLSKVQYRHLLDFAANEGCQYLTFNVPNSECQDCGFIAKQHFDVCPKCGSTNICDYDRIIGYLTKIANWSDGRKKEQVTRVYENWRLECLAELTPAEQAVAIKWEEKLGIKPAE